MSETLTRKRCFNHAVREAAARCPECERFFCRECVTEHEGRVLCVGCIAKRAGATDATTPGRLGAGALVLQSLCAFTILWLVFFTLGRAALLIPSSFHEEVLEQADALEDE